MAALHRLAALITTLVITTAWARSPLEMLCDGDRLIVVAGYDHSGTSILQAQLARRNRQQSGRIPE